ncbi:MAG: UDP-N-acetylmuramoylalanine--D-glutamate ligase [Deltaproteobacteria bacterium RIFCSPHIGHO2_12_FULL_43_9]|nr:MAG: UDP-N-acetylmuramoylalanine--D-glutamate ligase [Deltaproteobacteria bacterium RIFCSPHIGHO2_12_FULL_43_9]
MEFKGKRCLVVGLGLSGISTIKFLRRERAKISVSESRTADELRETIKNLNKSEIEFEFGGHTSGFFQKAELIIISPGIPYDIEPLLAARKNRIPVIGEMELACQFLKCPILAVTGTNGKSTTASLLHQALLAGGKKSFLGGNIGKPLIDLVLSGEKVDYAVVEVSSFQLETTEAFHPQIATCLNVTADHLDRHPTFEEYLKFKKRIYLKMGKKDLLILNGDDDYTRDFAKETDIRRQFFSRNKSEKNGCIITSAGLRFVGSGGSGEISFSKMKLTGAHNQENVAAASLMAKAAGIPINIIQKAIDEFRGLPHRMEFVRELNGVRYYNDSKGTNVGSTVKSVESFNEPLVLLAGGKDKGTDLSPLNSLLKQKVKALILFGEAKERMRKAWGKLIKTIVVDTLEEGVKKSRTEAKEGDIVLFSPACSSFDQFRDYKHRGECFRRYVKELS